MLVDALVSVKEDPSLVGKAFPAWGKMGTRPFAFPSLPCDSMSLPFLEVLGKGWDGRLWEGTWERAGVGCFAMLPVLVCQVEPACVGGGRA